MSINWVMLHETQGFARLPGEKPVWKSPSRTSLALVTPRGYPGNSPLDIQCESGIIYLTNQRIVYLPTKPTKEFRSFSAPLLNLHDSHITVPWFGPNQWQAIVQPIPGGNIPPGHSLIELKFSFKEGGAPDFHSHFERIKERLQQAVETAQADGIERPQNAGAYAGVNMDAVHLDQLPTYEASAQDRAAPMSLTDPETPSRVADPVPARPQPNIVQNPMQPPSEAPPGYEETQQQSVQEDIERRLMQ